MKNNFIPPFHKKEHDIFNKTTPAFLMKNPQGACETTVKKMSFHVESSPSPTDVPFPGRHNSVSQEESKNSEQPSSCKSSQTIIIPYKMQQHLVKQQREKSPYKQLNITPLNRLITVSPNVKQSHIGLNNFMPMRATMKNMPLSKSPLLNNKKEQNFIRKKEQYKDFHLNSSFRANKTFTQMNSISPSRGIERQFQKLREENQALRRQLYEVKNSLICGSSVKKEDLISNLRDTIKKQDSQIKDLRIKLDIFTKKNNLLTTLIENKDQQIFFLSNKLSQTENELRQCKQRNAEKFQKLKERINFMIKSYNDLESKWSNSQMEWLEFKQKWMQEKQMYTQRITFLESYIAQDYS